MQIIRDRRYDLLRGVLIIMVVLGHTIQFVFATSDFDDVILFRMIYSFHMPLFMCLSGYVVQATHGELSGKWVAKRASSLILVFLSWSVLDTIIHGGSLYRRIVQPDTGLWFFWALAFITVFTFLAERLSTKIGPLAYVAMNVLLVILPIESFGASLIKRHYTWFAIGYIVPRYWKGFKWKSIVQWSGLIGWPITVLFWVRNGDPSFSKVFSSSLTNNIFFAVFSLSYRFYLVPFLGIVFMWTVWNKLWRYVDNRYLRYIGCHTTEIYAIHYYCWMRVASSVWINSFISFIAVITIPLFCGWFIGKWKWSAFLLLGKWPKKR